MNAIAPGSDATTIDIVEMTIADIQDGLATGRFTAEALTAAFLQRIEKYEPFYNAFTFMNPTALEDARKIDARRAAGETLGPLAGVPVVVKEAMDMVGFPSTGGWAELHKGSGGIELMPLRDAPVVARMKAAGAVIMGKTNVPALSMDGARTTSSWDGPTYNAVNRRVAPGASSAGTGTAISASFAVVGLAEETGGSIQNPGAAQSLVSVKPTFALVPNSGVAPIAGSTRDVVGPHARTVTDAAILLDVLAGYTPDDQKTVASIGNMPKGGYTSKLTPTALRGARIGLYGSGWRVKPLSEEARALYGKAMAEVEARGAVLVEDPFAGSGFTALSTGDEFDPRGIESVVWDLEQFIKRFGPDAPVKSFSELNERVRIKPFSPEGPGGKSATSPLLQASLENPSALPDLSSFLAARIAYLECFNRVMSDFKLDALIFPQMSADLPPVDGDLPYPATTVSEINIAGLPGVTVPAGQFASGAPFSLILVGRMWSEAELLAYAYDYEQATRHRIVPVLEEQPFG
jgi:Asp-tRNA(Asn)/Glu-tRNA(Gln) amidotransferase A subunit family amidase